MSLCVHRLVPGLPGASQLGKLSWGEKKGAPRAPSPGAARPRLLFFDGWKASEGINPDNSTSAMM